VPKNPRELLILDSLIVGIFLLVTQCSTWWNLQFHREKSWGDSSLQINVWKRSLKH